EYLLQIEYRNSLRGEWLPALLDDDGLAPLLLAGVLLDAIEVDYSPGEDGGLSGVRPPGDVHFHVAPDGRWEVNGEAGELEPTHVAEHAGELYLSPEAFALFLPVELTVDRSRQRLRVRATGPLPLDLREQRRRARDRLASQAATEPVPLADFPYRGFGRLSGDLNVHADHRSRTDTTRSRYDARLVSELGWLTTDLFVRGDDRDSLRDARLQFGREAPAGGVFGISGLTSV